MGQDAKCIQKTVDDRAIILNVRAYYFQPFLAPDWTDLRVGFFLSVCGNADPSEDDDTITGIAETITGPHFYASDRYWLGVTNTTGGGTFAGFTNVGLRLPDADGDSTLVASDAGIGTGTAFWRPGNSRSNKYSAAIFDRDRRITASNVDNLQQHFPQDAGTVAAGYAVLLGLQLLRDNAASKNITMRIKSTTHSADMLYSNTPTKELIHTSLDPWPASAQLGPVTVSNVPDTFYFYWPWHGSRLRIHSLGLLRAA